jgi:hypothetical protein
MLKQKAEIVIAGTPWEEYTLDGVPLYVKREDLCCPAPGPSFSKIRGVYRHLSELKRQRGVVPIGVMDTVHSKAGWGVAYICQHLGLPCYDFFPVLKAEGTLEDYHVRTNQRHAGALGAQLMPMQAGMSAVLFNRAKTQLKQMTDGKGYMMPNALKLEESIVETALEVASYTPDDLLYSEGTWLISVSSGTIAAGVLRGLVARDAQPIVIAHMGYNRSEDTLLEYMLNASGTHYPFVQIVNEKYEYKQSVEEDCPFPCNSFYDLKAWKWLMQHYAELQPPIIFWNVGA